jgi:hypothetical protein
MLTVALTAGKTPASPPLFKAHFDGATALGSESVIVFTPKFLVLCILVQFMLLAALWDAN